MSISTGAEQRAVALNLTLARIGFVESYLNDAFDKGKYVSLFLLVSNTLDRSERAESIHSHFHHQPGTHLHREENDNSQTSKREQRVFVPWLSRVQQSTALYLHGIRKCIPFFLRLSRFIHYHSTVIIVIKQMCNWGNVRRARQIAYPQPKLNLAVGDFKRNGEVGTGDGGVERGK